MKALWESEELLIVTWKGKVQFPARQIVEQDSFWSIHIFYGTQVGMPLSPSFSWIEDSKRIAMKAEFLSSLAILGHCAHPSMHLQYRAAWLLWVRSPWLPRQRYQRKIWPKGEEETYHENTELRSAPIQCLFVFYGSSRVRASCPVLMIGRKDGSCSIWPIKIK